MTDKTETTPAELAAAYHPPIHHASYTHARAWWDEHGADWYGAHAVARLTVEKINQDGFKAICAILTTNGIPAWPGDGTGMILNIIRDQAAEIARLREPASHE